MKIVKTNENSKIPEKAHEGDAGFDLRADLSNPADIAVFCGGKAVDVSEVLHTQSSPRYLRVPSAYQIAVPVGFRGTLPEGHVGMICSRSGMALKYGIQVLNAPGIIDSGYTGIWKVILGSVAHRDFKVFDGDKIAQLVIVPFASPTFQIVGSLEDSDRGADGFGSTGSA